MFVLDSKIEEFTGVHGKNGVVEKDPLVEEMQIRQKHGGFRGGGVLGEVGRRRVLPGGERGRVGAGVDELLVRSEFTPRPSQIGARSLRPEIPARRRKFRPTGNSGLPPERLPGKHATHKAGHE